MSQLSIYAKRAARTAVRVSKRQYHVCEFQKQVAEHIESGAKKAGKAGVVHRADVEIPFYVKNFRGLYACKATLCNGHSAAESLETLLSTSQSTECRSFSWVLYSYALLKIVGASKFDQLFSDRHAPPLIEQFSTDQNKAPIQYFLKARSDYGSDNNGRLRVGELGYFHGPADGTPWGDGEFVIRNNNRGFNCLLFLNGASEAQISKKLENFRKEPASGIARSPMYSLDNHLVQAIQAVGDDQLPELIGQLKASGRLENYCPLVRYEQEHGQAIAFSTPAGTWTKKENARYIKYTTSHTSNVMGITVNRKAECNVLTLDIDCSSNPTKLCQRLSKITNKPVKVSGFIITKYIRLRGNNTELADVLETLKESHTAIVPSIIDDVVNWLKK